MNFKELQRFFSGGFSKTEKAHLLNLFKKTKGIEMISTELDECWLEAANIKGPAWDSGLCFIKILMKVVQDGDHIHNNTFRTN